MSTICYAQAARRARTSARSACWRSFIGRGSGGGSDGCVELGGGWDSWTVPGHEDGLGQRRWRAELGWCPALLVGRKGPLTAALRVVVGGGVAGGQIVLADAPDRPVLGAGPFLRVEIPVRIGIAELGFRVGWAPYGRGGESFVRPMSAGLGVAIGRRPHTKAE